MKGFTTSSYARDRTHACFLLTVLLCQNSAETEVSKKKEGEGRNATTWYIFTVGIRRRVQRGLYVTFLRLSVVGSRRFGWKLTDRRRIVCPSHVSFVCTSTSVGDKKTSLERATWNEGSLGKLCHVEGKISNHK